MYKWLDQEVRKVAQRPTELGVEPLSAGVRCHLGGQASEQATQCLCPVAFQGEEILQLRDDLLDELPLARGPAPIRLRPRPPVIGLRGSSHQRSVDLQPAPLPRERGETLVGQVGFVTVARDHRVAYGSFVAVGQGQSEGRHHTLRKALTLTTAGMRVVSTRR